MAKTKEKADPVDEGWRLTIHMLDGRDEFTEIYKTEKDGIAAVGDAIKRGFVSESGEDKNGDLVTPWTRFTPINHVEYFELRKKGE